MPTESLSRRSAVAFNTECLAKLKELLPAPAAPGATAPAAGPRRGLEYHVLAWVLGDQPAQLKLPEKERKALVQSCGRCAAGSTLELAWSAASSEDAALVRAHVSDSGWSVTRFQHEGGMVTIAACREQSRLPAWKQQLIDTKRQQRLLGPAAATPSGSQPVFVIEVQEGGEAFVRFRDNDPLAGHKFAPPVLAGAVRNMTHFRNPRDPIPIEKLHRALGRLRAIQHECSLAARSPDDELDAYEKFVRGRALEQLQGLGCSPAAPAEVEGLADLISALERHFMDGIQDARAAIKSDKLGFWHLGELYKPGTMVVRAVQGLHGERLGMMVKSSWYEDHKTIFGSTNTSFHITCEFVASVGSAFAVCTCDEILSAWTGPRRAADLDFVPLAAGSVLFSELSARGMLIYLSYVYTFQCIYACAYKCICVYTCISIFLSIYLHKCISI